MQHHPCRHGGHAALLSRFLDGKALQLHVFDETSLPVGQTLQQPVEIGSHGPLLGVIGGKKSVGILERDLDGPFPATQVVNELVTGQGICPGREWKRPVVGFALQMHGKECLLDQVLDFGGGRADAAGEVSAKTTAEGLEELTVSVRVSLQAAEHQRPEALFGVLLQHLGVDSLAARVPRDCNAGGSRTTNREISAPL